MADTSKPTGPSAPKQGEHPEKKADQHSKTGAANTGSVVESVTEKAKDVAAAVGDAAGQAKEKVQDWAVTATEKTKDAAAAAGHLAVQAKDKAQEWTATATDKAGDAIRGAGKELTALVRRYPSQAFLVGVAIGFLVERATTRR
jgi:hypothetical protein